MTNADLAAILRLREQFQREVARSAKHFVPVVQGLQKLLEPVSRDVARFAKLLEPMGREVARFESEFRAAVEPFAPLLRESAKFFEDEKRLRCLMAPPPPPSWALPLPYREPAPAISNEGSQPPRRPIGFGPWPER